MPSGHLRVEAPKVRGLKARSDFSNPVEGAILSERFFCPKTATNVETGKNKFLFLRNNMTVYNFLYDRNS